MGPKDRLKRQAAKIISRATDVPESDIMPHLEKPPENIDSDLSFPAFALVKKLKKEPQKIAGMIAAGRPSGLVKEIRAAGPYANFYADRGKLGQAILEQVLKEREKYGSGKPKKEKILVEHTSANPDGPLHLGHFRNSVLGDSIARILSFSGYSVKTDFFVNDTGRQIAIAVLERRRRRSRPEGKGDHWVARLYIRGNRELERNPDIEKDISGLITGNERGDDAVFREFSLIVDRCLEGHRETLERLGIRHDSFTKESMFIRNGSMKKLLNRIRKLPEGRHEKERLWLDLKRFGIEREFTLTREDGTSIYPARDMAYHQYKFGKADINVNIIGTDQKFYFKQLKSALSLLYPEKVEKYPIVFYEFLLLPEGSMSTRAGKFVAVDDVLDRALKAASGIVKEKMPEYSDSVRDKISEMVAVGALKYAMIKVDPQKTYAFSVEDTLRLEGNNAPYLQYTHARACSILRKSGFKSGRFDASRLGEDRENALIEAIMDFPAVVSDSARDFRPNYLANYAYMLATRFNDFYNNVRVLQAADPGARKARLALVKAFQITIKNCLFLLGIKAPERM